MRQIDEISQYDNHKCKDLNDCDLNKIDENTEIPEYCIYNYWNKIVELNNHINEIDVIFDNNQLYFPLEIANKHSEILNELYLLIIDSHQIKNNLKLSNQEKAFKCFELFRNFKESKLLEIKFNLLNEYRLLIGVSPTQSYQIDEYRKIIDFDRKIERLKFTNNTKS